MSLFLRVVMEAKEQKDQSFWNDILTVDKRGEVGEKTRLHVCAFVSLCVC